MAKVKTEASPAELINMARHGAPYRLAELDAELTRIETERNTIRRMFPGIEHKHNDHAITNNNGHAPRHTHTAAPTHKRRKMSRAARKAISIAQRARWEVIHKAKAKAAKK